MKKQDRASIESRRQALMVRDASNRCVVCKRNLFETGVIVEDFCVPGKCCSDACLKELIERADR